MYTLYYKRIFFTVFIFTLGLNTKAQHQQQATKIIYNEQQELGTTKFRFIVKNNDTLLQGPYAIDIQIGNPDECREFETIKLSGNYYNNQKNAAWQYTYQKLTPKITGIQNYTPLATVSGIEHSIKAGYRNNKATGVWTAQRDTVYNSKKSDNIEQGKFDFSKNSGIYVHNTKQIQANVSVNENGFFEGKSVFSYYQDTLLIEETRMYEDGFLLSLHKKIAGTSDSNLLSLHYEKVIEKLDSIKNKSTLIEKGEMPFPILFDDGFPVNSIEIKSQLIGNEILNSMRTLLFESEIKLSEIDFLDDKKIFSSKRFIFPFTAKEQAIIDAFEPTELDSLKAELKTYQNNKRLEINRFKSSELAFSMALSEHLSDKIEVIQETIQLLKSDSIVYKNRNILFRNGIQELQQLDTLVFEQGGNKQIKVVDFEVGIDSPVLLPEKLKKYTQNLLKQSENLFGFFDAEIIKLNKLTQLNELEEQILERKETIDKLYLEQNEEDSIQVSESNPYALQIHTNIATSYFNKQMEIYSNENEFAVKKAMGESLLQLFDTLETWFPRIEKVYLQEKRWDEVFTKYAYNPFTDANDIKERIKRRIYQRGAIELWSFITTELLHCNNLQCTDKKLNEIELLSIKLLELASKSDRDTHKIERKLKNESDSDKIKRILDL
jgi:hypothetical protein